MKRSGMDSHSSEEQRSIVFPFVPQKKIPQNAILALGNESWEILRKLLPGHQEKKFSLGKILENTNFSCVGPATGSPAAALFLEQMIASGAKNIIALGCAGSLQPGLLIGDYLLATGSLSEEGTSSHYFPDQKQPMPDTKAISALADILQKKGISFQEGMVWTTDAPYRELVWKVKKYQESNIYAVEMEISALYTVARFHGVALAAIVVISDELFTFQWKRGFNKPLFKEKFHHLAKTILESFICLEKK